MSGLGHAYGVTDIKYMHQGGVIEPQPSFHLTRLNTDDDVVGCVALACSCQAGFSQP